MKPLKIIFLFAAVISLACCHNLRHDIHDATSLNADPKVDYASQGYVKAYVTQVALDGCMYMLHLEDDNKNVEPDELDTPFQKDSLKVWVKYTPDDRISICMAGQTVKVLDIRKR